MSRKALWLFLAAGLAWGVPYFFIAVAVKDFSTYSIVLIRVLVGALVLIPLALKTGALKLALKHWRWVLLFAFLEMVGPWWLITEAGRHISSGLTGLLIATVPFFAVVIASFLGDKSVWHPKTILGLVLGFSGVVALVGIDSFAGFIDPLWVGAVILASVGYALAPAIISHKIGFVPTAGVVSLSMVMVGVVYLIPALSQLPAEIAAQPAIESWIAVLVLGVVCSAIAFIIFFALIKEIGAARATLITYLNTLVALVLGIVFLNEPITPGLIVGIPLVLVGSWFAGRRHEVKVQQDKSSKSGSSGSKRNSKKSGSEPVGSNTSELDVLPKG
jgi:drug/metabolite transporter (DMT)-like permease